MEEKGRSACLKEWLNCSCLFGRIRMEQLMAITQEETEHLRRKEVACKSRQLLGVVRSKKDLVPVEMYGISGNHVGDALSRTHSCCVAWCSGAELQGLALHTYHS